MKKYVKPVITSSVEMEEKTYGDVVGAIPFLAAAVGAAAAVHRAVKAFDDKDLTSKLDCLRKVG